MLILTDSARLQPKQMSLSHFRKKYKNNSTIFCNSLRGVKCNHQENRTVMINMIVGMRCLQRKSNIKKGQ